MTEAEFGAAWKAMARKGGNFPLLPPSMRDDLDCQRHRRAKAHQLRADGHTMPQIASRMGITKARVWQMLKEPIND